MTTTGGPPSGDQTYKLKHHIWARLPDGGEWTVQVGQLVGNPLIEAIRAIVAPDSPVPDYAGASAWLQTLVSSGFVFAEHVERAEGAAGPNLIRYVKVATPPEPDTRPWHEIENERIAAEVARFERERQREVDAQLAAAEQLAAPERAAFARQVHYALTQTELGDWLKAFVADEVAKQLAEARELAVARELAEHEHPNNVEIGAVI